LAHKKTRLRESSFAEEELIAQSLDRFAAILIRAGLDLSAAERVLRRAFIKAAESALRQAKHKATQSRIASIAGVSRLEVRRFAAHSRRRKASETIKPRSRIESVISGWTSDPAYCTPTGKARPLTFRGSKSQFSILVQKYGRDVTAKTLRMQLVTQGLAVERSGAIYLTENAPISKRSNAAFADLRHVASHLANIDFELGRRSYQTRRTSIVARDRKTIMAIQRIALTRFETVLNSLASMSTEAARVEMQDRRSPHRLIVSSTIALETEGKK
jgi:hypothetical protein